MTLLEIELFTFEDFVTRLSQGEVAYIRVKEDYRGRGSRSRSHSFSPPRRTRGSPSYSPMRRSRSRSPYWAHSHLSHIEWTYMEWHVYVTWTVLAFLCWFFLLYGHFCWQNWPAELAGCLGGSHLVSILNEQRFISAAFLGTSQWTLINWLDHSKEIEPF